MAFVSVPLIGGAMNKFDEDDLDGPKDEGPLSVDLEEFADDDGSDTLPCPICGAEIYDKSVRCHSCGQYVTPGRPAARLWWWTALALAGGALIAYLVLLRG